MRWIVDADPGIDDAAAIITAIRSGMDIIGITTVSGNSPVHHTTRNALILVEMLSVDIPVYQGASRPLLEEPKYAPEVHGDNGFGNIALPDPVRQPESLHASDFIIDAARRYRGELSLLTMGPLTNVALAVAKDREACSGIGQLVMMGGTSEAKGNHSITAEFNVHCDPEAAAIVMESGIPITMVPWETTAACLSGPDVIAAIARAGTPIADVYTEASRVLRELVKERMGVEGLILCDLVAAAVIIDPQAILRQVMAYVVVETGGRVSRGLTAADYVGISGKRPNVKIILEVDADKVNNMLIRAMEAR